MRKPMLVAIVCALLFVGSAGSRAFAAVKVVASTSWVAAIAEAAGADQVDVLAPLDLKHPPEYDFRPSDLQRIAQADYVLWAGYEPFMRKIQSVVALPESRFLQVFTDNVPVTLKEQARKLAAVWATQDKETKWEESFDAAMAEILRQAKANGLIGKRAVVQAFLVKYAQWMGLQVVGTFGGGEELTPAKAAELLQKRPEIVVDNWHNAQGAGLAAEAKVPYALLLNFPGHAGTRTLIDVLRYNAKQFGL